MERANQGRQEKQDQMTGLKKRQDLAKSCRTVIVQSSAFYRPLTEETSNAEARKDVQPIIDH